MKKLCTVLLAFWLAAWTVVPSPDSSLQNPAAPLEITQIPPAPSMTPAITLTPSSVPTASATLAPPQMAVRHGKPVIVP